MKHWLDDYSHFLIRNFTEGISILTERDQLLFFLWEKSIPYQYSMGYTLMNLQLESSQNEADLEKCLNAALPFYDICIQEDTEAPSLSIQIHNVLENIRSEIRKFRQLTNSN